MTGKDRHASPSSSAPTQLSRQQILEATTVCLRRDGYDATTIRRIAEALSCAIGSIYRYFEDKHELLSAVTQQSFDALAQRVEAGGTFEQTAPAYAELAGAEAESYRLMFWLAGGAGLPAAVERIIAGWSAQLGDARTARRRWAVLHGAIIAGENPTEMLSALGLGATRVEPAPLPERALPALVEHSRPHDDAPPLQIVAVVQGAAPQRTAMAAIPEMIPVVGVGAGLVANSA